MSTVALANSQEGGGRPAQPIGSLRAQCCAATKPISTNCSPACGDGCTDERIHQARAEGVSYQPEACAATPAARALPLQRCRTNPTTCVVRSTAGRKAPCVHALHQQTPNASGASHPRKPRGRNEGLSRTWGSVGLPSQPCREVYPLKRTSRWEEKNAIPRTPHA